MQQSIAVIDYGMGNLRSVAKAVEAVSDGARVVVTADAAVIRDADRIVCPGQGAARECMAALAAAGLGDIIRQSVTEKPFLGICMGLQVLMTHSDENGGVDCLDIVPGQVKHFGLEPLADAGGSALKIPHMGWSQVDQIRSHELMDGIDDHTRFYFAHSYYVVPAEQSSVVAECLYGRQFAVALQSGYVFACQFHPEKSADAGLRLIANFTRWHGD